MSMPLSSRPSRLTARLRRPHELGFRDWRAALRHTLNALLDKNLPTLAAGTAFFATLAFFPLLAAAVAILAAVIEPRQIGPVMDTIEIYLPRDIAGLIDAQLQTLVGKQSDNLIFAASAILFSILSASGATDNLIQAANETYDTKETRPFWRVKLISLVLTLGAMVVGVVLIGLLAVTPEFLTTAGLPAWLAHSFGLTRWLLLVVMITVSLAVFYRYGPARPERHWHWVSWGALAATVVWLAGTALFFVYVQNFGNFTQSYGIFAGIIALMIWLALTAFIFLLGSEVNYRLKRQSGRRQ